MDMLIVLVLTTRNRSSGKNPRRGTEGGRGVWLKDVHEIMHVTKQNCLNFFGGGVIFVIFVLFYLPRK